MASLLERMKRTTRAQLDGYRKWDIDAILAPRADNCTYQYLPASLGRPPMNNEQFKGYFATMIPLLQGFDYHMVYEAYDEQARMSVSHGFPSATSAIGPYKMEAVIMMTFDETGEKVVKIDEMIDNAYIADYLAKLTAHLESQGQPS